MQLETFCTLGTSLIMMHKIGSKKPKTIKDFFNTKKFPGKRAIYKGAMSNLEIALVADGVKASGAQAGGDLLYRKMEGAGIDRALA